MQTFEPFVVVFHMSVGNGSKPVTNEPANPIPADPIVDIDPHVPENDTTPSIPADVIENSDAPAPENDTTQSIPVAPTVDPVIVESNKNDILKEKHDLLYITHNASDVEKPVTPKSSSKNGWLMLGAFIVDVIVIIAGLYYTRTWNNVENYIIGEHRRLQEKKVKIDKLLSNVKTSAMMLENSWTQQKSRETK